MIPIIFLQMRLSLDPLAAQIGFQMVFSISLLRLAAWHIQYILVSSIIFHVWQEFRNCDLTDVYLEIEMSVLKSLTMWVRLHHNQSR